MMMKCPDCGCRFREQEGYEEEDEMEDEMPESEGELVVKEVDVSSDKEEMIKKKLLELGKMMASISK